MHNKIKPIQLIISNLSNAAFYACLTLLMLSVVHLFLPDGGYHQQQRLVQLVLLFFLLCRFLFTDKHSLKTDIAVYSIIFFGLVAFYFANYPLYAIKEWALVVACYIAVRSLSSENNQSVITAVMYGLIAVAGIKAFEFLIAYLASITSGIHKINAKLLLTGFSNTAFLNQFQVLVIPVISALILQIWQSHHRFRIGLMAVLFTIATVHSAMAFATGGRAIWLAFGCVTLIALLLVPHIKRLLLIQTLVILVGLFLFYILFVLVPEWLDVTAVSRSIIRETSSGRIAIWANTWDIFIQHPWFGIGPMHLASDIAKEAGIGVAHPHQITLQWLAEWGLFATIIACGVAVYGIVKGLLFIRSDAADPLDAGLWLSIVATLIMAQVDGNLVMPYPQTWFMLLVGVAIFWWRQKTEGLDIVPVSGLHKVFLNGLTVLVLLIITVIFYVDVIPMFTDQSAEIALRFTPRFWSEGWIP